VGDPQQSFALGGSLRVTEIDGTAELRVAAHPSPRLFAINLEPEKMFGDLFFRPSFRGLRP
jgi:hypothetical protein